MPILQVQNLTKIFKSGFWPFTKKTEFTAVNTISFDLKQGEILGFLGTNGAGKSTTIHMLLGVLRPTSGIISYFGKDFNTQKTAILKKVTFASGFDKLPARLTIWENLDIVGRIYSMPHNERIDRITSLLKFFDMWDMRNRPTGTLSSGQATRITLAKAFLSKPSLVLLDEPTATLDPDAAKEAREFVLRQNQEHGVSILFTSHNMDEVTQVCDRVLVLKSGTIIANNTPEQLARSVAQTRVHLMISNGLEQLIAYLQESGLKYTLHEHGIEIAIEEHGIAALLIAMAERKISYTQISIDKPTLEDYFLSISKK